MLDIILRFPMTSAKVEILNKRGEIFNDEYEKFCS